MAKKKRKFSKIYRKIKAKKSLKNAKNRSKKWPRKIPKLSLKYRICK